MVNWNHWQLKKYQRMATSILALEDNYTQLSDEQLKGKTGEFRNRMSHGESLSQLLVEAYATVREADRRVLGLFPYANQVLGATILNGRNIAEMATGEGKTLTATMPMYLNGLAGPGAFLVTSNDYLAQRDAEEMGQVYHWLGLTSMARTETTAQSVDKAEIYRADIVYTTYNNLGFDYLLDNLVADDSQKALSHFRYALVDEVDSVLLDMAQTPLVIAGAPKVQSNLFETSDRVVKTLTRDQDYEMSEDRKQVWFTPVGIQRLSAYFGVENLLDERGVDLYRHLQLALRANTLFTVNRDYVVSENQLLLLDIQDGRTLPGMHLEAGMHQALEAKEGLPLSAQNRTMASVTYQNLFRMFPHLAGMTGTAATDRREFLDTYDLRVLTVSPHKPNVRIDLPDELYVNNEEKLYASLAGIQEAHDRGQPVLIETGSVSLSELYSLLLLQNGIAHNVLNAKNAAREAAIIKDAGQMGAVTVATSMAGRGTDIKLGPGAAATGGLLVIGTERMTSRRVDNQLRGRAGRQGDPGLTKFYVALDDRVIIEHGPQKIGKDQQRLLAEEQAGKRSEGFPITNRRLKKVVSRAQKRAASQGKNGRQSSVAYDNVLRTQQNAIYQFRNQLMVMPLAKLLQVADQVAVKAVKQLLSQPNLTLSSVLNFMTNTIDYNFIVNDQFTQLMGHPEQLKTAILQRVHQQLTNKMGQLAGRDQQEYYLRLTILHALDNAWIEQVDNLHQLRAITSTRSVGQHDPMATYQLEAVSGFNHMKTLFWRLAVQNIVLSSLHENPDGSFEIEFP
ncbi:accessory Sec system translocase SecA2 [Levilactobacillus bambusae]|uniref:Protein translocase subunit SecA n=1 Tax=Levilactobacillus bambusae TaxID=2024736 RepID=A0A2V1N0H4_9LACO|nr:accessory Sec system translocase SecA2 [Levilactobacillus bambusae]PWF99924.1 accessory Sec system translocase SecA2 [Levilactobacillus bambusae]